METGGVKWSMLNGGLAACRFRCSQSHTYTNGTNEGANIGANVVVEQFRATGPDGSEFLVSITKLAKEED